MRQTGHFVDFFADRHPFNQVLEGYGAGFLGEDRKCVRIPLRKLLPFFDTLAIGHFKSRTVVDLIPFELATALVGQGDDAVPVHCHQVAFAVADSL